MPVDTFICGSCNASFVDLEEFVTHKRAQCNVLAASNETQETPTSIGVNQEILEVKADTQDQTAAEDESHMTNNDHQTVIIIQPPGTDDVTDDFAQSILQGTLSLATDDGQTTTLLTPEEASQFITSGILPSKLIDGSKPAPNPPIAVKKPRSRPRGKKKVEQKPVGKPENPEMGPDGKPFCPSCKRSFAKERHFNTHKCLGSSDYVDLTKKEALDSMDIDAEDMPESDEEDHMYLAMVDQDDEFKATIAEEIEDDEDDIIDENDEDEIGNENEETGKLRSSNGSKSAPSELTNDSSEQALPQIHVSADPEMQAASGPKATDVIKDLPIFPTEEEKVKFEASLVVDLSCVDHMFKQHVIEQDLNEKATAAGRLSKNALSLYSCNTCQKIFKTLSHMRSHCLTHTDIKPFKCTQCSEAYNSKGNLYTHMRKHTGQFFRCPNCDFKSVNKTHLLEHMATHNRLREKCQLCLKMYKTTKSLINHIRKYHSKSSKGKAYLQQFLATPQEVRHSTVIHQCHVCNRKFKKKMDRDRHLFVHDIKDIPSIQHCDLCEYSSNRKVYLEKHYQKHRVIYRCVECQAKFLSTIRLMDHLTSEHTKLTSSDDWEELFERCINYSLYLPEPDENLSQEMKELVNLPAELSSSMVNTKDTSVSVMELSSAGGEENVKASGDSQDGEAGDENSMADSLLTKEDPALKPASNVTGNEINAAPDSLNVIDNSHGPVSSHAEDNAVVQSKSSDTVTDINDTEKNVAVTTELEKKGIDNEKEEEETETGELVGSDSSTSWQQKGAELRKQFGYLPMTWGIFQKMRKTFGTKECEYCGKLYNYKADYESHVRTHTGDKTFSCSTCSYQGSSPEDVARHHEEEHGAGVEQPQYRCDECPFVGQSRLQLWNHSLKHKGLMEEMGIECPVCQTKHENLKKLRAHFQSSHPEINADDQLAAMGLSFTRECDSSQPKGVTQGKMGRRSYKCPYCEKVFTRTSAELQKHMWVHEGIKPFKCPMCTYACRSKHNLQAHMLRHMSWKPYSCSECGKAYKSQTALRWHVRSHKDGKLFKCDKCPYEASQKCHLKRHMETHDVVKKYTCQHCEYSANTLGYMKIHYTRNHKGVKFVVPALENQDRVVSLTSQTYRCVSCDYLFGNLTDLKRHLKIRHGIQNCQIDGLDQNNVSEFQVVTCAEEAVVEQTELIPGVDGTLTAPSHVQTTDLDAKTASAVNILQQIIDLQQQGTLGPDVQQITLQSDDGQMVSMKSDTIIVQGDGGEEMFLTNSGAGFAPNQQFVIEYITPEEMVQDQSSIVEVQTVPSGEQEIQSLETYVEQMDQS